MMSQQNNTPEENQALYSAFDNPNRPEPKKKRPANKRLRTLLIALAAVVVLVGVLLLIPLLPEQPGDSSDTSNTADNTYPLLDKTGKEGAVVVQQVAITNKSGNYTVLYDSDSQSYQLKGYADLTLDSYDVETLTDCLTAFNAQEKLNHITAMADYGLQKPTVTAKVNYRDNSVATIKIGNTTPDGSGYYVTLDDKAVYICSESMVEPLLMAQVQYVQTTLYAQPIADEDDTDGKPTLREVTLTGLAFDTPLAIRHQSSSDGIEYQYFSYVITQPYFRGVSEAASTDLAATLSMEASSAVVLHPTKKQLAAFGFDKPAVIADLTVAIATSTEPENSGEEIGVRYYNNVHVVLRVGSTDEDGNYYVMVDGTNAIFLVARSQLSTIAERRYENTVSNLLFLKDITTLSQVNLTMDGKDYGYKLAHHPKEEEADDKLTVTDSTGKVYSTADFRTLYSLAMGITRYGNTKTKPTGKPAVSITFKLLSGDTYMDVDFYQTSGSLYTAYTSEGELFTVKASAITEFIKQATNYADGKPVIDPQ